MGGASILDPSSESILRENKNFRTLELINFREVANLKQRKFELKLFIREKQTSTWKLP